MPSASDPPAAGRAHPAPRPRDWAERTPVLVGAAQWIDRDPDPATAPTPLDLLESIARSAADDAGAGASLLGALDTVGIVQVAGWSPRNPAQLVADRIGAPARHQIETAVGGEMGVLLLNRAAARIAAGESGAALLAGVNQMKTWRRLGARGRKPEWPNGGDRDPERLGENKRGESERERAYGLKRPTDVYPLFENALRAHRGLDLEAHRLRMGALMSRFSEVAAGNPYAWFPVKRSAAELVTVTPANRMIAFPYPKYLNAVLDTDQAAGVLLTSVAQARRLGIPEDRQVPWLGGAGDQERAWFPTERPDFAACPAMRRSVLGALAQAGVGLDAIDAIDFYSCFPAAVEMACEMLGLDETDPRGLTVTGGLPYAGGPANNYTLHAIATMLERLRERPGARGLVTGNGWYLTKHAAAVLGGGAPAGPPAPPAPLEPAGEHEAPVPVVDRAAGPASIETYTVLYDREGPRLGIAVARLDSGERCLAHAPAERAVLEAFAADEQVGRPVRVRPDGARNRLELG